MKKITLTLLISVMLMVLVIPSVYANDNKPVRQLWIDGWSYIISDPGEKKLKSSDEKWDAFTSSYVKTKLCSNYYYKVNNLEKKSTMHRQADYIIEAGIKVGLIKASSHIKLLRDVTNIDKNLMNSWQSDKSPFLLKTKGECTKFSREIKKLTTTITGGIS